MMTRFSISTMLVVTLLIASCGAGDMTGSAPPIETPMTSDAGAGTTATTTRPEPAREGSADCPPGEVVGTVRCELESAGQIRSYLLLVPTSYVEMPPTVHPIGRAVL